MLPFFTYYISHIIYIFYVLHRVSTILYTYTTYTIKLTLPKEYINSNFCFFLFIGFQAIKAMREILFSVLYRFINPMDKQWLVELE